MTATLVFVLVSLGLLSGKLALILFPTLRRCFVPSSIIGGLLALLIGPEVWGRLIPGQPGGLFGEEVYFYCGKLPGFLISVVFAGLFLGESLPKVREIWRRAGPQVAFGQAMAWGMYAVGLGITMVLLVPLFNVPPVFGTLLEIGFEGGHGTAAGMSAAFESVGWDEVTDLALSVATVGVVFGVGIGMLLINWGVRQGHTRFLTPDGYQYAESPSDAAHGNATNPPTSDNRPRPQVGLGKSRQPAAGEPEDRYVVRSIDAISLHIAMIGLSIGVGALLLMALQFMETQTLGRLGVKPLLSHMPLFPLAMIGGIIVQRWLSRFLPRLKLEREVYVRLQGVALDFLIVSAMAALSLRAIAANFAPLLILMAVGTAWILGMFLFVAPRIFRSFWFERGIGDLGQSFGMTATGLLLMKIVDPEYRSPAMEAFGYKQLLFEPFVGGGLVTAMSVPLVANYGPWPFCIFATLLTIFWIALGIMVFGRGPQAVAVADSGPAE